MALQTINPTYLGNGITNSQLATPGKVLQVIQATDSGVTTTTSATPVDFGLSANITPSSTSNKILATVDFAFGGTNDEYPYILLLRDSTSIGVGSGATGNQINTFMSGCFTAIGSMIYRMHQFSKTYLDSPSTTSEITYKLQWAVPYQSGATTYANRAENNSDNVYVQHVTSNLTLMEISA